MKRLVRVVVATIAFCLCMASGVSTVEAKTVTAESKKVETVDYKVKKTTVNEKKSIYVGSKVKFKVGKKVLKLNASKGSVSIAKDGTVSFKKAGSVKLTGKLGKKKYTVKVEVQKAGLNAERKELAVGKNFTIKVNGTVAKSYQFDGAVVSVNSKGRVTAKKAGTTTIKVKCKNDKTYKCKVTVKAPKLSKSKVSLGVGETVKLSMEGTDGKVKWTSSKSSVATVNNKGKVTAKKAGTATIKAKVDGKTYQCKVTVKKAELNATKVELWSCETFQLELKGAKIAKCESDDLSIADVDNKGLIDAFCTGTTQIVVTDTNGNEYRCKVTVKKGKLNAKEVTLAPGESFQLKLEGPAVDKNSLNRSNGLILVENGKVTNISKSEKEQYAYHTIKDVYGKEYECKFTLLAHKHEYEVDETISEPTPFSPGKEHWKCKHCGNGYYRERCLPVQIDVGGGKTETIYGYWDLEAGEEMCRLLNEYRKSLGLNELDTNDDFMEFARVRAAECGVLYDHDRPNGGDNPGEVISTYETAESAIEAWKKSEGHNNTLKRKSALYSAGAIFFQYEVEEEYGWQRCTHEYSVMNLYNESQYEGFYEGIFNPVVLPQ